MFKTKPFRLLCGLLAALLLTGALVACGDSTEGSGDTQAPTGTTPERVDESETEDPVQAALDAIGKVDFDGRDFTILYQDGFKSEVYAADAQGDGSGTAQVISEAVFTRNTRLEELCELKLQFIERDSATLSNMVSNEAVAPTGDFQMIDAYTFMEAGWATNAYLRDFNEMGISLEGEWWDQGTADFVLAGGVYFMSGSLNTGDDHVTYLMAFNKNMQKTYANTVPNPYDTVRAGEWTLEYFNSILQGISKENGDGKWDEKDTYGFVTSWVFGQTFFFGADLRYVINDDTVDEPQLYLSDARLMERAINTVNTARKIYHDNHATYMAPGGQEANNCDAFIEDRAMFFGDTCGWIGNFNTQMESDYGIVPIPKYDKAQEHHCTWTHASGSSVCLTSALNEDDLEIIGDIMETYALLSHRYLKPAYYDTVLASRNMRDADSVEMLDILFNNRIFDMPFYFTESFGSFGDIVHECVNQNADNFNSKYTTAEKMFNKRLDKLLSKLEKE